MSQTQQLLVLFLSMYCTHYYSDMRCCCIMCSKLHFNIWNNTTLSNIKKVTKRKQSWARKLKTNFPLYPSGHIKLHTCTHTEYSQCSISFHTHTYLNVPTLYLLHYYQLNFLHIAFIFVFMFLREKKKKSVK